MAQSLYDLLHGCIVRISTPEMSGTGFFVAPGLVLTCDHVVAPARQNNSPIQVSWKGQTVDAQLKDFRNVDKTDLALLTVNLPNQPCVLLYGEAQPFVDLYTYGYPGNDPQGVSATFACEGWAGNQQEMLIFKLGQVRPGMSGSPVLNRQTGSVCGIIQISRDVTFDLGGKALLSTVIFREFPELTEKQKQYHQQNREWVNMLDEEQRKTLEVSGLITSTQDATGAFEIFYSYAEEDENYVKEIQKHLVLLKRKQLITDWHAGKIVLQEEPNAQIIRHLNTARIILLFVSSDFIASEYHDSVEVKVAMDRQKEGKAIVIPILLRPIDDLQDTPFGKLQPIPRNRKPISKWSDRDEAFTEVAKEIRQVVEALKKANPQ